MSVMLKIARVKPDLLTDYDMIMTVVKGLTEFLSVVINMTKQNSSYVTDYGVKNKNTTYLKLLGTKNLYN